jgi:1-aminocyclopropane-1-carboxylate deaminase/D-cysteine desulfhydrase-like pyridoxal-dependent ACC family enzyme
MQSGVRVSPGHEAQPFVFGRYPTPVEPLARLGRPGSELWVKRDDVTSLRYGGNKVRKLERLLADAVARGAKRVVTLGAAGSHHVLATALYGRQVGLEVEAVLVPQPRTEHAVDVLRASIAAGAVAWPVQSWSRVPPAVLARMGARTVFIPVGGSSVLGAMGYVDAALELASQVRAGAVPEPDVCVVAAGSGGTAAGLAAGFLASGLSTRVVGVCVGTPRWAVRFMTRRLARGCSVRVPEATARGQMARARALDERLSIDERFLGPGYGHPTDDGAAATRSAMEAGLSLDPTYTAKAFACALWHVRSRRARHILYWHTLSSAPEAPLLEGAASLEPRLDALLA